MLLKYCVVICSRSFNHLLIGFKSIRVIRWRLWRFITNTQNKRTNYYYYLFYIIFKITILCHFSFIDATCLSHKILTWLLSTSMCRQHVFVQNIKSRKYHIPWGERTQNVSSINIQLRAANPKCVLHSRSLITFMILEWLSVFSHNNTHSYNPTPPPPPQHIPQHSQLWFGIGLYRYY